MCLYQQTSIIKAVITYSCMCHTMPGSMPADYCQCPYQGYDLMCQVCHAFWPYLTPACCLTPGQPLLTTEALRQQGLPVWDGRGVEIEGSEGLGEHRPPVCVPQPLPPILKRYHHHIYHETGGLPPETWLKWLAHAFAARPV